jgi:hypothetical protein
MVIAIKRQSNKKFIKNTCASQTIQVTSPLVIGVKLTLASKKHGWLSVGEIPITR